MTPPVGAARANAIGAKVGVDVVPLTWETAAEWDNRVSASGIEHSDARDPSVLRLGQEDGDGSWQLINRFHTGSGSTLEDLSGNNNDGSISGPVWSSAPSPRFAGSLEGDGTDDYVDYGAGLLPSSASWFEIDIWIYPQDGSTTGQRAWSNEEKASIIYNRNGNQEMNLAIFGDNWTPSTGTLATNTWHHAYFRWEIGTEIRAEINGTTYGPYSTTTSYDSETQNAVAFLSYPSGSGEFDGKISELRVWAGSSNNLSPGGDTLYVTSGSLTTATKSFSSSTKPDLQNLDYSLNGQSITLDVIGSPGTGSEETVSQALDGTTSFDLTWSNSHTDFRVKPRLSTADETTSPTVNRLELTTP